MVVGGDSRLGGLVPHVPCRLEGGLHVVFGKDDSFRDAADTVGAGTDVPELHGRHSGSSTSDATSVTASVSSPEAWGSDEVKGGESAGFPQGVSITSLVMARRR